MITWPASLIEDIARRRVVLFLGAGVSKNSVSADGVKRPPMWQEFLEGAIPLCPAPTQHIRTLIGRGDFLTACEIIKDKMDDEWFQYIHREFVEPRYQPSDIHAHIFKLDARIVLTQNVDRIYDSYAQSESSGTVLTESYMDNDVAHFVRGDRQCIIKAHGSVESPDNMIFTRSDYARARYQSAAFYTLLDSLAATHTFVFLGCGLSDPDVQIMLEKYRQMFTLGRPHFMAAARNAAHQDVRDSAKRNMNLKTLVYRPDDSHKELGDSLEELVARVDAERTNMAGSMDW